MFEWLYGSWLLSRNSELESRVSELERTTCMPEHRTRLHVVPNGETEEPDTGESVRYLITIVAVVVLALLFGVLLWDKIPAGVREFLDAVTWMLLHR